MKNALLLTSALALFGCDHLDAATLVELARHKADKPATTVDRDDATTRLFRRLGKASTWKLVSQTQMQGWNTYHTQGLVKIGDHFYVSAVETIGARMTLGRTDAINDFSIDRTPGTGKAYLFKFDGAGNLLGQIDLTEGDIYHPGGIDFDGKHLWVPVAEYRPNSNSTIWRVDPATMTPVKAFTAKDHIGGIVHDRRTGKFHGVSWGSRRLYTWSSKARPHDGLSVVSEGWVPNRAHYIDYQDCHQVGVSYMLCGGLNKYPTPAAMAPIAFGGIELVDLIERRPEHQIPANHYIDEGKGPNFDTVVTGNAFWPEVRSADVLRFYFMTESDNQADLVVYDVEPWKK